MCYNSMIQNIIDYMKISLPMGREEINELGRKCPYHRYVKFPVEIEGEIEIVPKIKIRTQQYVNTEKEVVCDRFVRVPGWVWPFSCDYCGEDIRENQDQIVVNPTEGCDGEIYHYHVACFEAVKVKE